MLWLISRQILRYILIRGLLRKKAAYRGYYINQSEKMDIQSSPVFWGGASINDSINFLCCGLRSSLLIFSTSTGECGLPGGIPGTYVLSSPAKAIATKPHVTTQNNITNSQATLLDIFKCPSLFSIEGMSETNLKGDGSVKFFIQCIRLHMGLQSTETEALNWNK